MSRDAGEPLPTTILSPREVLEVLDGEFPIERFDKFFTIFYGVLNCHQGLLTYSNAGHQQPILLHPDGSMDFLDKGGTIIGMGGIIPFEQEERYLEEGDKIILYSDGVTELEDANNNQFGMERLRGLLNDSRKQSIATLLDTIHLSLMEYVGPVGPQDDLSLFGIEITGLWREKYERDAR
jgi:sigma-B regulation protein RsbU (phosphoserine phosphatase)